MDDLVKSLLTWFFQNRRDLPWRRTRDPWTIWVSEVMLQQTRVTAVIPFFLRFMERFPTPQALAEASEEEALKAWEGLGYYRRVRYLWQAARKLCEEGDGRVPCRMTTFSALPGVGEYTAAAVLSQAFGVRRPAVDGNVLRVWSRVSGLEGDPSRSSFRSRVAGDLERRMPVSWDVGLDKAESVVLMAGRGEFADRPLPGLFNEALMELGATVCIPMSPNCPLCPLSCGCRAFQEERTEELPFRPKRADKPLRTMVAMVPVDQEKRVPMRKRLAEGLLSGLWEPPLKQLEHEDSRQEALCLLGGLGGCAGQEILVDLGKVTHMYSHFRAEIHVFACRWQDDSALLCGYEWVDADRRRELPVDVAGRRILSCVEEGLERHG